jgi:hypothetical protein
VHYIPVANIHQFVIFSQYFRKHEPVRSRLARDASEFYRAHYAAKRFWQALKARSTATAPLQPRSRLAAWLSPWRKAR